MKKTSLGLGSVMMMAALSLTACGGADEGELAKEYCELARDANDAVESGDAEKAADAAQALTDWAEENKDATGDADKFADAVKDECSDVSPNLP
ncbi:MAG: hypothetical protein NTX33_02520 [Propionibacteriales bacterium]|nr:hypothetical protein [Propionibacteriales bacterium]